MYSIKRYLFEILIVLSSLAGAVIFYQKFGAEHSPVESETAVAAAVEAPASASMQPATGAFSPPPDLLSAPAEVILRMDGSNTIGDKLAPAVAAAYLKQLGADVTINKPLPTANEVQVIGFLPATNQVVAIAIKAHGSSTGFRSMLQQETDIAMSSRPIKESENLQLLIPHGDMTRPESEHVIALDGLAIIVHPDNPLRHLTVAQLAQIFAGEITHWSQLGGADRAIKLYARDDQSGTYDTFNSLVLKKSGKQLAPAKRFESNEQLARSVAADAWGIGFTGLAYARTDMILKISADDGIAAIEPKQFSISSEDYALSRRLFLYANTERSSNPHVSGLIDFALSINGQHLVEQVSFIPQKVTASLPVVNADFPVPYQRVALHGERLSVTFRMRSDRAEIDNKSAQDIEHLVNYLQQTPHQKVTLIGFSAGESQDEDADKNRAFIRSKLLAFELKQRGIKNVEIIALGNALPIDSNDSEWGRYRNNRTEIWVTKSQSNS
ncbi:substrate-binding domain-containing protein [Marinicella meishanensis]|uniref:substrate-binding domain-containing protein n=1 Tax=Marinicella meishanensis TaxID=2873263 RepID=UPI001CBB710E|nr:substrate-binding domain-containing protein [Marinicella sp. NBU2979]